jgi:7-carboxy-7-deazaguanine synthase
VEKSLKINEIFFSIQGESTHAGRPCVFVRLSGCPLRCTYCDTEYAFYEGRVMNFEEIISQIQKYPCNLVEVTGGEPLAQRETKEFLQALCDKGYEVMLETSGAISIDQVPSDVTIILDVKGPSSGESQKHNWANMSLLKAHKDEIKFVIETKEDFLYLEKINKEYRLTEKHTVLVSPSYGKIDLKSLADWILSSAQPYRFQTQLHKLIWGPEVKGV